MSKLKSCCFCGDTNPVMKSGACTFTTPDLFMAQVHCGHCGASGTRLVGEDDLAWAEQRAREYWNEAHPAEKSALDRFATLVNGIAFCTAFWLLLCHTLYDGLYGDFFVGLFVGIVSLRIVIFTISVYRSRHQRQAVDDEIE